MAKKKAKSKARKTSRGIKVNARGLAQAIMREVKAARKAVAQGERAVAAATKAGRMPAAARNQRALDRARRVLSALEAAQAIAFPQKQRGAKRMAMSVSCPFDTLSPEPFTFE